MDTDETIASAFRQMSPDERRAVTLDLIEHADDRFDITGHWTMRVYKCEACGHETLTIGGELPYATTCYAFVPDPERPRRKMICGGKLDVGWVEE